ncbi:MAG: hypothetical protein ACW96M_01490 [Candidatus Thorarchaeota archaeon]|jgi:hypothetical protein
MKILDKLLDVFGRRRQLLLGAKSQPTDLIAFVRAVRADAYFKITGKKLPVRELQAGTTIDDMTKDLSPSRRLNRRNL